MDIVKELEQLEDKFFGEWEEEREPLIQALTDLHIQTLDDRDAFNRFLVQTAERFGGVYIPYLFWQKLADFMKVPEERAYLQELIKTFIQSNFEAEEQRKLKPLLVVYFAKEKDFEVDKTRAQYIDQSHPQVRDYFNKLLTFVKRNEKATNMYIGKFEMLQDAFPDFELLNLPITQLKEKF
jgi:hypothetical protein